MNMAIKVPISVDSFVNQLSLRDKLELARRLQRETRRERWSGLLGRLRKRAAKKSISEKEILQCIHETRREMNA